MRGRPFSFTEFGGGLNAADSIYQLAPKESRDCRNVVATPRGALRQRDGSVVLAKPAVALDSLYPVTAVGPVLVGQGGTKLYGIDPAGAITDLTGTSGATAGKRWTFAQAVAQGGQGPVYGMDGSVAAQWTGAGTMAPMTANSGTLPIGKFMRYVGNRLWVAGLSAYTPSGGAALVDPGSALVFSQPGAPRDYPATNVVQFDPGDGEAISGIGSIGGYVLVFKPSKTWVVYDLDTGANRRLSASAGCVSHRSIVETPLGAMFLTKDQGVAVCDGNSVRAGLFDKVLPLLKTLAPTQRSNAAAAFHGKSYYLSFSTAGVINDLTLEYRVDLEAWWPHTLAAQQWALWDQGGVPRLFCSRGAAVGGVFTVEEAFVAGQSLDSYGYTAGQGINIPSYWKGIFHTFGAPFLRKRVRDIRFDGSGDVDVYFATDFANYENYDQEFESQDSTGTWGGVDPGAFGTNDGEVWGGQVLVGEGEVLTPGVARAWSLVFRNPRATSFEVESYTMAITPRKD